MRSRSCATSSGSTSGARGRQRAAPRARRARLARALRRSPHLARVPIPAGRACARRKNYPQTAERDIRLLTAAHFFSIVPLHEEREHQERYLRASESMLVVEGLL